jgi:hypothetical protein
VKGKRLNVHVAQDLITYFDVNPSQAQDAHALIVAPPSLARSLCSIALRGALLVAQGTARRREWFGWLPTLVKIEAGSVQSGLNERKCSSLEPTSTNQ